MNTYGRRADPVTTAVQAKPAKNVDTFRAPLILVFPKIRHVFVDRFKWTGRKYTDNQKEPS